MYERHTQREREYNILDEPIKKKHKKEIVVYDDDDDDPSIISIYK